MSEEREKEATVSDQLPLLAVGSVLMVKDPDLLRNNIDFGQLAFRASRKIDVGDFYITFKTDQESPAILLPLDVTSRVLRVYSHDALYTNGLVSVTGIAGVKHFYNMPPELAQAFYSGLKGEDGTFEDTMRFELGGLDVSLTFNSATQLEDIEAIAQKLATARVITQANAFIKHVQQAHFEAGIGHLPEVSGMEETSVFMDTKKPGPSGVE